MRALILSLALLCSALAQGERGFQTPSGNIHCMIYALDGNWEIRCDILQTTNRPPVRPADCTLDWGNAFFMTPTGRAARICHGDTVANPNHPKLAYGQTLSYQGFTCVSRTTGLRCTNKSGRGFELSRARQVVF
ncbi:MAG: DUF6636 domain-containing protein [Meiothermus sp.]|nr:DUF6636 domain-containing protein [Meiothermus sp.]